MQRYIDLQKMVVTENFNFDLLIILSHNLNISFNAVHLEAVFDISLLERDFTAVFPRVYVFHVLENLRTMGY